MAPRKVSSDSGAALFYDPFLARILSLEELPVPDRLNWIGNTRSVLERSRDELSGPDSNEPFYDGFVRKATLELIEMRLKALDHLYSRILQVVENESSDGRSSDNARADGPRAGG
jgi:hypothetical protein